MTRHLDEDQFELPASLKSALRDADQPPNPPIDLDARVMRDAKRHLHSSFGRRNVALKIGLPLAAAAALGLAFIFHQSGQSPHNPNLAQIQNKRLAGDLNADGQINIVDSYLLAVRLEANSETGSDPVSITDLNGDGQLTQADVDYLANQAVKLR